MGDADIMQGGDEVGYELTKRDRQERLRRNEEKWTLTLMDAGWTSILEELCH
jgi:hypothetical protein